MSAQEKLANMLTKYPIQDHLLSVGLYLAAVVMLLTFLNPLDVDGMRQADHGIFSDVLLPHHCVLNNYDKSAIKECLWLRQKEGKGSRILFVGDDTVRPLFKTVASITSPDSSLNFPDRKNVTLTNEFTGLTLTHIYVDSVLKSAHVYDEIIRTETYPDILIYGTGWKDIKIKPDTNLDLLAIQEDVSVIISPVKKICKKTLVLWTPSNVPADTLKDKVTDQMDIYNGLVKNTLASTDVVFWPYEPSMDFHEDVINDLQKHRGQLIVEWLCNSRLSMTYDSCFTRRLSRLCLPIFIIIILVGHTIVQSYLRKCYLPDLKDPDRVKTLKHGLELSKCIINMLLIMAYFHFCDREPGNGVQKHEKEYSHLTFIIPISIIGVVGCFTSKKTDDVSVLNRYQSDDWKGWMQLVILTYHFTGASKMLPIYFMVRLLVTSYLLLNGYGQFTFFFLKGNFGWMRLGQTFVRLNLLVVLLCLVMSRQYQFYYFVPLVSFWFVAIYITMGIWPQINLSRIQGSSTPGRLYLLLAVKLTLLVVLILFLTMSNTFFDAVFGNILMAPFFKLGTTLSEWRFRWNLDRFSVVAGMLFALMYQVLSRKKLLRESADSLLCSKIPYYILSVLSVLVIMTQIQFAALCPSKFDCNRAYSYFGAVPVLGYVLIRNLHPKCRSSYSPVFAWVGKISLELFIAQYHIWLADDTKKLLVLIPGYPTLNFILITYIFVSISFEIQRITSYFASYFMPRKVLKPPVLPQT